MILDCSKAHVSKVSTVCHGDEIHQLSDDMFLDAILA